jgi:hypothetical protein
MQQLHIAHVNAYWKKNISSFSIWLISLRGTLKLHFWTFKLPICHCFSFAFPKGFWRILFGCTARFCIADFCIVKKVNTVWLFNGFSIAFGLLFRKFTFGKSKHALTNPIFNARSARFSGDLKSAVGKLHNFCYLGVWKNAKLHLWRANLGLVGFKVGSGRG